MKKGNLQISPVQSLLAALLEAGFTKTVIAEKLKIPGRSIRRYAAGETRRADNKHFLKILGFYCYIQETKKNKISAVYNLKTLPDLTINNSAN